MYGRIVDCRFNFGCRFFIRCLVPGLLTLATNECWYPLEIRYLEISFMQVCSFVGYLLVFFFHIDCPKCSKQVHCYADPCMSHPCGGPNTVCNPCYCFGCDYTCERPLKG